MPVSLILGGARSGKSQRAEALVSSLDEHPVYVATAPLIKGDTEWLERIERHKAERAGCWQVIEEEVALLSVLSEQAIAGRAVLVDCLTLWLSNLMFSGKDFEAEVSQLCDLLPTLSGHVVLVANEVGMGLVPENPEGRAFRDAQGRMNQKIAAVADKVEFIVAGLPICMKGDKA